MTLKLSDERSSPSLETASENELLVRAIAEGDPDAERAFAERYLRPIRVMLLTRSRNPDLTADLLQDVMIEAICGLRRGQLRDPEKLSAFVSGIARNKLNNYYRANRRTEPLDLPDDLPDLSCTADQVDEEQREGRAAEAIASLEPLDRAILQMTLVDGLKPGAIAQKLQLSPDVVRQRKLRATRRVIDLVRTSSQTRPPNHIVTGKEQ
jgi:RNA polymerase sigma factor (sigma-70 family)